MTATTAGECWTYVTDVIQAIGRLGKNVATASRYFTGSNHWETQPTRKIGSQVYRSTKDRTVWWTDILYELVACALSSDPKLFSDDHLGHGQGPANILMPDSYHIARTRNNSFKAVGLVRREERYAGEKMKEIFCSNQSSIEKPFNIANDIPVSELFSVFLDVSRRMEGWPSKWFRDLGDKRHLGNDIWWVRP